MRLHKPETQTLYAQLFEATVAYQVELMGGFANGLPIEREVRQQRYLYWQLRDLTGRVRQVYLGPAHDPKAQGLRDALVAYKDRQRPLVEDLKRLTAAYIASGGASHIGGHYKVVDALARAGLFRAGAVLVGSHAFVSNGAALGVSWTADTAATADVDFCRDEYVSVACDELQPLDLPAVLNAVDPSFFLVPELDLKAPSTSMKSRDRGVKVDFLTTAKHPRDTKSRNVAPFGLAAKPLRYMDYLVREDVQRGLFIGPAPLLVNIPHAGRFALHKLAVAACRAGGDAAIKANKDRRQAAALILALEELLPGALSLAAETARTYHDAGFLKDVKASLRKLPKDTADLVQRQLG